MTIQISKPGLYDMTFEIFNPHHAMGGIQPDLVTWFHEDNKSTFLAMSSTKHFLGAIC